MSVLPWLVIAALVALNAFYVAAEFAAVAVERSQVALLARQGRPRAVALAALLEDGSALDRYIAACQIGITLSSLVAGAYGQASFGMALGPWLATTFELGRATAQTSAFVLVLFTLTTLQVVLGELVPKSLALQFPARVALATYVPMRWSVTLFRAFIVALNGSGFLLLRPFGVTPGGHQHAHTPAEIDILLATSRRAGALSADLHRRLDRGLHLSARSVRDMMTPRLAIDALEVTTPPSRVLERILASPYGRLPVYRDTLDNVLGAVSTKDLVGLYAAQGAIPPLASLLRPLPLVPDTLDCRRLVRFLQGEHASKALVVDEHGVVQGLISIEDVLGELFGSIGDELKAPQPAPIVLGDGSVRLAGGTAIDTAEPWLRGRWHGSASTVGGHVVQRLGRLPRGGERCRVDGIDVTVTEMGPTAIRTLVLHDPGAAVDARGEPGST